MPSPIDGQILVDHKISAMDSPSISAGAVVLVTSNGTGMGHLTRQISIALSLNDGVHPVFFSLSRSAHVIDTFGFSGEYCPSRERGWMPSTEWQEYLRHRLRAFIDETGCHTVVFDGVVPYHGLLRARMDRPWVRFVWMRRGFWRKDARISPLRSSTFFDLVLEPGDLASSGDVGPTVDRDDAVRLPPVSIAEHGGEMSREAAAAALGLDPNRPTALVTLSSGVLNDVVTVGAAAVNALLAHPEWQVAVTRTAVTKAGIPLPNLPRCVELNDVYPLAHYFAAFDAAVAGGGYNSVHELLYAGVPTVFVPNQSSKIDDQARRARLLASRGLCLYADEANGGDVSDQVARLHDPALLSELREACSDLERPQGSIAAAEAISAADTEAWPRRRNNLVRSVGVVARHTIAHMLGPSTTASVRRVTGRSRERDPGPRARLPVHVAPNAWSSQPDDSTAALTVTSALDAEVIQRSSPVEQVLPYSSSTYRDIRSAIINRFYDVAAPHATSAAVRAALSDHVPIFQRESSTDLAS